MAEEYLAAEPEASGDSAGETGVLSNLLRELTDKGLADLMQLPEVRGLAFLRWRRSAAGRRGTMLCCSRWRSWRGRAVSC